VPPDTTSDIGSEMSAAMISMSSVGVRSHRRRGIASSITASRSAPTTSLATNATASEVVEVALSTTTAIARPASATPWTRVIQTASGGTSRR
jgi:hypothetical protein